MSSLSSGRKREERQRPWREPTSPNAVLSLAFPSKLFLSLPCPTSPSPHLQVIKRNQLMLEQKLQNEKRSSFSVLVFSRDFFVHFFSFHVCFFFEKKKDTIEIALFPFSPCLFHAIPFHSAFAFLKKELDQNCSLFACLHPVC